MRLRTLIVDDEPPAREKLRRLLSNNPNVDLIGEAEDGTQALQLIEEKKPELVLLDIQMPGLDGFEVLRMLEEPPLIIFVTAYDQYAIQAFEVNALDYLLKPFSRERLNKAIERALREYSSKMDFSSKISSLLETLKKQSRYLERIGVREHGKIFLINADQIDWMEADQGLVFLHVGREKYIVNYTLEELERRLDPCLFFRSHRSAIVNLSRIKEIIPWFSGTHKILLTTGEEVELSRNRAKELKRRIGL